MCIVSDPDLGFSYGNPIITKNRQSPTVGGAADLGLQQRQPAGSAGRVTCRPGPADRQNPAEDRLPARAAPRRPAAWPRSTPGSDTFATDNTASAVLGAILQGNIWEFDTTVVAHPSAEERSARRSTESGRPAADHATKPELGPDRRHLTVLYVGTERYLGLSDMTDPATQTPPSTDAWQNSLYAFKISPHRRQQRYDLWQLCATQRTAWSSRTSTSGPADHTRTASTNSVSWAERQRLVP